jgi:NAD(P)-dependent dehydrogenase (short-subunit alcohol dehydrogenase family)
VRTIRSLMDLTGRKALITGGGGHVGFAAAQALVEMGARVALLDVDGVAAERRSGELSQASGGAIPIVCDLSNESAVRGSVQQAAQRLEGLDILVHCAAFVGTTRMPGWAVPFDQQTAEAWKQGVDVNLTSAFVLAQEARAFLAASGRGSVVLVSSIYGLVGWDPSLYEGTAMNRVAAYSASKGGLLALMRHLSTLFAPAVRVNALTPGGIERAQPAVFKQRYSDRTPMKRMATEEDMKGAIAYLASDLSAYVTGHNLIVDGGWTAW